MSSTNDPPEADDVLSRDALILHELDGKGQAVHAYDEILWKIRAGYVVVLYGAITVLSGKTGWKENINEILAFSIGFSILFLLIDFAFLHSKMKVVRDREELQHYAFDISIGEQIDNKEIKKLMHHSGESSSRGVFLKYWDKFAIVAIIYLFTPIVGLLVKLFTVYQSGSRETLFP